MKSMSEDKWNLLAKEIFDMNKSKLHPGAMDNKLIAYPEIHRLINRHFKSKKGLQVLDFGCGTGNFATEVSAKVKGVIGIDPSLEMIEIANREGISNAEFILGDINNIPESKTFDIIIAAMVFQFIQDIDNVIARLCDRLNQGGILIFAVHNNRYIEECLRRKYKFYESENRLYIQLSNVTIPVFNKSSNDYVALFSKHANMVKYEVIEPPFSETYLKLYADEIEPAHISKFLIMSYVKK